MIRLDRRVVDEFWHYSFSVNLGDRFHVRTEPIIIDKGSLLLRSALVTRAAQGSESVLATTRFANYSVLAA